MSEKPIDIAVVGARQLAYDMRRWSDCEADGALRPVIGEIHIFNDLDSAFGARRKALDSTIFVVSGFDVQTLRDRANAEQVTPGTPPPEILVVTGGPYSYGRPALASPMQDEPHVITGDLRGDLRKSLIKLRVRQLVDIRPLNTSDFDTAMKEYEAYFALRYKVWTQLGYLAAERDSRKTELELDYTDRSACAVGAFTPDGRLVGCARLVRELGYENAWAVRVIKRIIRSRGDLVLEKNFQYPHFLMHPYDLLESFDGFGSWYRQRRMQRRRLAELSRVIVAPDEAPDGGPAYRKRGVGEAIVDAISYLAGLHRIPTLFLACLEKHRGFYERCGYTPLEQTTDDNKEQTTDDDKTKMMRCESFTNVSVPAIAMFRESATP